MNPVVEVAIGVPVPRLFTYTLPPGVGASVPVGTRVLVPWGKHGGVTGVVVRTWTEEVDPAWKEVRELLDETSSLDTEIVSLCLWIADYYAAPVGEVFRAAMPPGTEESWTESLALSERGRTFVDGGGGALPAAVRGALAALAAGKQPKVDEEARQALIDSGLVVVVEERRAARNRPRMVPWARLAVPLDGGVRGRYARAPRKREVLEALAGGARPVAGLPSGMVRALVADGVVVVVSREAVLEVAGAVGGESPLPPTEEQAAALAEIGAALDERRFAPFLLHGITGSGKTEVYLQAIARARDAGRGALVLVPEIALTPQLASRFRARFGDEVVVLHSGLGDAARLAGWRRLRSGAAKIAVGARSAVFAPVRDLGVVVVDEEHDPSFKQEEGGARYHARDVAMVRAQRAGAVCVLGSATPSMETRQHADDGRYRLLTLHARPNTRPLPEVELVDLRVYKPDGETLLTAPMLEALERTLAAGEQAILFLNRRGFATFVVCVGCGHAFRCGQCSVSLTYHRTGDALRCHYCGHRESVPTACPKCQGAETIRRFGLGTERIEDAIAKRFPAARVGRLDRDTAAGRGLETVLGKFARRELDVLVGTQMVTKGHDFPGVTLVGVLLADGALSLPDFRAAERTFQLLTQVAGRAGRGDRAGKVLIQTYAPDHHAVACAKGHDYAAFFAAESAVRAELGYPPHGRLLAMRIDGPDDKSVRVVCGELAARAAGLGGNVVVLGPSEAPLARLKGRTRWHVWLKHADRAVLRQSARRMVEGLELPAGVRVTVDVDPVAAL